MFIYSHNLKLLQVFFRLTNTLKEDNRVTSNLSADQIASRIGFFEATTLRRAFKKWTGLNIKEFRRKEAH